MNVITNYLLMKGRPPLRDVITIIKFPEAEYDRIDVTKYYNRIEETEGNIQLNIKGRH